MMTVAISKHPMVDRAKALWDKDRVKPEFIKEYETLANREWDLLPEKVQRLYLVKVAHGEDQCQNQA